jgi:hypothetical protein
VKTIDHTFAIHAQRSTGAEGTSEDVKHDAHTKPAVKMVLPFAQGAMKQQ